MKVVQVSTSDTGGAGIAAYRLHRALSNLQVSSSFLSLLRKNIQDPNGYTWETKTGNTVIDKILRKLHLQQPLDSLHQKQLEGKNGQYEIYSFPESDYRVEKSQVIADADLVNLHWVSGFINYPTFFSLKKPLVWTLHDMNPFMGGFHYRGDYTHNQPAFEKLEQQNIAVKKQALSKLLFPMHIVTPSAWLAGESKQSEVLGRFPVSVIHNSVNTWVFKHYDQAQARAHFNLPADKKILLFVSHELQVFRKGFDLLLDALKSLNAPENFVIVAAGKMNPETSYPDNIIPVGALHNESEMALLYAAADAYILPSREDNLPNVMLESIACGTPVIGFNTGGIPEVIHHKQNGILVDDMNAHALKKAIEYFLEGGLSFDKEQIIHSAHALFAPSVQAGKYRSLYESILQTAPHK